MGYTTVDQVRDLDVLNRDENYTDEMIVRGIAWAKARIDEETGTVWECTAREITIDGNGTNRVSTGIVHLQRVTLAEINGVSVDPHEWICRPLEGTIFRPDGPFPCRAGGMNMRLTVEHGLYPIPADLREVALELARWSVLNDLSNGASFATQQMTEWGPASAAAYGGKGRPTALPDVNAVLRRHNHKKPYVS